MNAPARLIPDAETQARIEAKRREALAMLGSRYLLHPANRVQRVPEQRVLK